MLALKLVGALFLCFFSFLLLFLLFLFVCGLFVDPKKLYDKKSPFYRAVLNAATGFGLWLLRVKIRVEGAELLPPVGTPLLFVSNHRSNFDPIVTWHAFRERSIAFVSKPENFGRPIFGRLIRRCCFLPIDRESPKQALKSVIRAAELLQKGEHSVGVYPEGTRSKDCIMLPFHSGVLKIAGKACAPVAVVSVQGTEYIHKRCPFRLTEVLLRVIEVIPAERVRPGKTEALGEEIRAMLEKDIALHPHTCTGMRIRKVRKECT